MGECYEYYLLCALAFSFESDTQCFPGYNSVSKSLLVVLLAASVILHAYQKLLQREWHHGNLACCYLSLSSVTSVGVGAAFNGHCMRGHASQYTHSLNPSCFCSFARNIAGSCGWRTLMHLRATCVVGCGPLSGYMVSHRSSRPRPLATL